MEDAEELPPVRRRQWLRWLGGFLLLLFIALAVAWAFRKPLARDFIDRELASRGVEAEYEITQFGLTQQRIANVVIGDPDDPDLTAAWAELHVRLTFGAPQIERIGAYGVRLRGELGEDGQLRFGQVDRLLPEPTGEPFAFPELDVALHDAQLFLRTPYGPATLIVDGEGPLHDGFSGRIGVVAPQLAVSDCSIRRVRVNAAVRIGSRRPSIDGPMRARRIDCGANGLQLAAPEVALQAVFSEAFDRWGGDGRLRFAALRQGDVAVGRSTGRADFDGTADGGTTGFARIESRNLRFEDSRAALARTRSHFRLREDGIFVLDNDVRLAGARIGPRRIGGLIQTLRQAEGTPLGPVGERLSLATRRAVSAFDADFGLVLALRDGIGTARVSDLTMRSDSGARLLIADGDGVRVGWPSAPLRLDGTMRLAGGGFPEMLVSLDQQRAGAPLSGYARIAPVEANGARLAMGPIRFAALPGGGTRIATSVEMTGPLAGGRVERLRLPINGTLGRGGALTVGQGCEPISFARLQVASLDVGASSLPLCPLSGGSFFRYVPGRGIDGGARLANLRLNGRLGGTPLSLRAEDFRLPLGDPRFDARNVALRLGPEGAQSQLDIATFGGDFVAGGVDGGYTGLSGQLASVPIRIGDSSGDWRFVGGVLDVNGVGEVTHTAPDPLFEPMISRDLALRLADNRVTLTGALLEPKTQVTVADVDLAHNLNSGRGEAVLATERLEFNDRMHPRDLTDLLVGIVAEVDGLVEGTGVIRWGPEGVTSEGTYRIIDTDLAASFGPVRGLNTELHFTDLLGLETAPNQLATMREVNPGVLVEDGEMAFQFLSGSQIRIEGGRWPFAGGEIVLEPTVLNLGADGERRMNFRLTGIDAFQFVEERDLQSIGVTGLFDGELPIVFDRDGARIEGGYLRSRPPGGAFSYEGEISDVNLGLLGTLAFNALELVRYNIMTLTFDGDLDGEMVTSIDFTGVTPRISREGQNFLVAGLTRQLAEIPVRFDITMRAPFQGLFYSVRLLDDPTFLVGEAIRRQRRETTIETGAERAVQGQESDDLP
ncbi:MAG: YdbH domain-containing protein [Parasphingopyxis sp.]|uniref:intermembrane phospholipid transport protein YdbH family protein n=1 Tax=Parasphingopyxis sp. TaxID=1920299 RepID=UPI0032ECC959